MDIFQNVYPQFIPLLHMCKYDTSYYRTSLQLVSMNNFPVYIFVYFCRKFQFYGVHKDKI